MLRNPPPTLSTRDYVYQQLRRQILLLELLPGTQLSENDSAQTFQVSRTPVRESFVRLAQEGLVDVQPQRGTFVSLIDSSLVEEARFMREQLERAVIVLACEAFPEDHLKQLEQNLVQQHTAMEQLKDREMFELDETFHCLLFEGCGKHNTWLVMQQMNAHLNRSRLLRLSYDHDWELIYEQHHAMLHAIKHHLPEDGAAVMQRHMQLTAMDQGILKQQYPQYYK